MRGLQIRTLLVARITVTALLFLLTMSSLVSANELSDLLREEAQNISDTIMSPFCPGRTLSGCPSPSARELRQQIIGWLEEGISPDEVRSRLINIYGDEINGVPSADGFGVVGWFMPTIFIGFGLIVVLFVLRRMQQVNISKKQGELKFQVPEHKVSPENNTWLDEEIKRRII